ncbi:LOW QUALITY PROTEIN: uncharacterized protein LOC108096691 [Drosophila ficusphila]|uniref:LOW QUALITY PROTEIN: uncharacterized protein LOC108096691 n=1 Tax=Drosophila ficusphila TaxID=30025 RepID=UPI0007E72E85|nr:LOW QUALITY PROTEIN: uncharacterized protein LOC108096691 [Drosophila ficusphila]
MRPIYQQEQPLFYQRPANLRRLRHPPGTVFERSYSLEDQPADVIPVYPKFIYAPQQQQHQQPYHHHKELRSQYPLYQLGDSLSSLDSDFAENEYGGAYIVEQHAPLTTAPTPKVVQNLNALGRMLELLQRCPLPCLSFNTACICSLIVIFLAPRTCAQSLLFPAFRLFCGTLYPAYASYKAVRTKDVKEYVKWMMYWIVFAFFTCIETFTDIFISWLPFYYEVKVALVFWLLSPATKGSSTLYRKFVHPMLTRHEQEIDEYVNQAKERGYSAVLQLGSKGVNYATNVLMQTAIKGGGNLVQTIKRSYSLSDLSEPDMHRTQDELDDVMMSSMASSAVVMRSPSTGARLLRPRNQTPVGRSGSGTRHSTGMYFTEVDVTAKNAGDFNYNIRSQDDISSGYSSAEPVSGLSRTSSMTNASKGRVKSKRNELLEEMRDEVYLDNQLYFQNGKGENSVSAAQELKIMESFERIPNQEVEKVVKEEEKKDEEDEDFYEALPLIEEEIIDGDNVNAKPESQVLNNDPIKEEEFEDALFEEPKKEFIDEVDDAKQINVLPEEVNKNQPLDQNTNGIAKSPASSTASQSKPYVLPPIDPFVLVLSTSASAPDPFQPERPRPMSPREMRDTLEEIKHSFRAQLEPEPPVSASPSPSLRPKANHGKGRAPPPPLPPKRHSLSPQPDAISQTSTGSAERKSGQIHVC